MSTTFSAPTAAQNTAGHSWVSGPIATLKRWQAAYLTWRMQQAAIAELQSMSDLMLKDMGLTRLDITGAVKGDPTRHRGFVRHF